MRMIVAVMLQVHTWLRWGYPTIDDDDLLPPLRKGTRSLCPRRGVDITGGARGDDGWTEY